MFGQIDRTYLGVVLEDRNLLVHVLDLGALADPPWQITVWVDDVGEPLIVAAVMVEGLDDAW